ncbi:cytochrome P450 [Pholiota molesta]|nr:cytochrome P450 [Pholiota molesta]
MSFKDTIRFWRDARGMLREGHRKFPGRPFQLPHADRWVVYVTDPKLVVEVSSLSNNQLSLMEASNDLFHVKYTGLHQDQQVVNLIRSRLTRNLSTPLIAGMRDVASDFINRSLGDSNEHWIPLPALHFMTGCASRVTARLFVGTVKANDEEYIRLSTDWAQGIIRISCLLNGTPAFCRRTVNWLFNPLPKVLRLTQKNIRSLVLKRSIELKSKGQAREEDEDFLDELIRAKNDGALDSLLISKKLLSASFAAIHTTSTILTFTLFYLASHPEYIPILRDEITSCIEEDQWSKNSLHGMAKLDSFLRESLRLSSVSAASIIRKTIQPITLSDGSHIPKGRLLLASPLPVHLDEKIYSHAEHFDGLRFHTPHDARQQELLISPSLKYFPFGYGPHVCPGRFIASSMLKIIIAQVILDYDMKLEQEERPSDCWLGILSFPDASSRVLFRRHKGVES